LVRLFIWPAATRTASNKTTKIETKLLKITNIYLWKFSPIESKIKVEIRRIRKTNVKKYGFVFFEPANK